MRRYFAFLFAAAAVAGNLSIADVLPPPPALKLENVPPVPLELVAEVGRYTESRAATFASWHPTANEMLISTRFANTLQIHSVAMPGGARRQLTFFAEPVRSASYDPAGGAFIIYGRDVGGGEFWQLYRMDLADGRNTLLTDGGRSQNAISTWSPDDRRFAYASTKRNGTDRDIHIMDPRDPSSSRIVCENKGGGWSATDWSPDGNTLLIAEHVSVNESHLWLVDVATGARTELTPRSKRGISRAGGRFSKDGKRVYLTTDEGNEFKRLASIDLATHESTFLTSGIDHDVTGISLSRDGRRLVFSVDRLGVGELYLMDTATRAYSKVEGVPVGVVSGGSWHRDNRHVAFNVNNTRSTSDVYVLDADTGGIIRWTESELGGINPAELRDAELIRWPSFDGLEISGFCFRPAERFTGKRPVIINIHGGPEGRALPVFQGRYNYLLNELGVTIIQPNVRGSTGFGKTFVALDNGRLREDSVRDIGALLDWVAQQPDLDASRVMITGGSYGGYMTLACAVRYNDRIRCSLDVVGISNLVTFLQNTESYRRDLRRVEYGDEREPEMRAFLESISPLTHAVKIRKPIFVVQGANDPRVPKSEALQMVASIRETGGQVWYMEASDEGHGFAKKVNSDYQFYSTAQFIRAHLLD
ncbi:MAG TPA: S9 family peptidase [Opitutaceae bacterium]